MIYLFDLDGTLTDSKEGIVNAIKYAMKKLNIDKQIDSYDIFIGPPIRESFKKYFGLSDEDAKKATSLYREYYQEKGKFENIPYDQIKELLEKLSKNNRLAVATSKPEEVSIEILKHFKLDKYFEFIGGASLDTTRAKKIDVIKYVLNSLNLSPSEDIYMIGDRYTDILSANELGLTSVGVLWGFGSEEELIECNAKYICRDVKELYKLLGEQ